MVGLLINDGLERIWKDLEVSCPGPIEKIY